MVAALLEQAFGGTLARRGARSAIGLDLGTRAIHAVQVVAAAPGTRPRIVAAASRKRPETSGGETAIEDLRGWLRAGDFTGRRVIVAAPGEGLLVGPMELPPRSSGAPLDQLARMEVSRNFRCPPDSFELDWWELPHGSRGRGTHALAVALSHASADSLLNALDTSTNLDASAIDAAPVAAVRACRPLLASDGLTAIVDLGWSAATLTLTRGRTLVFCRRVGESGGGSVRQKLQKTLAIEDDVADYLVNEVGLSVDESRDVAMPDHGRRVLVEHLDSLVRELSLSFSYTATQYPDQSVARLLLIGGGAGVPGYADRLAEGLGVETMVATPAQVADCDAALLATCGRPEMTTALGLALHELA